jgi:DNA-binding MarR family transcriptional regulator
MKITKQAINELYKLGFIKKYKKTSEIHISLNPEKKKEIEEFLDVLL